MQSAGCVVCNPVRAGVLGSFTRLAAGLGALAGGFSLIQAGQSLFRGAEEFNQSLTKSLSLLGDIDQQTRNDLQAAAVDATRGLAGNAAEAAAAFEFLFSAGKNASTAQLELRDVLQFAASANLDAARATELLAGAQASFGLNSSNAQKDLVGLLRTSNALSKAYSQSNATVGEFTQALSRAGGASNAIGSTLEETLGLLTIFADRDTKGQEAGTLVNTLFVQLQDAVRKNADEFEAANVEVFDNGTFVGIERFTESITKAFDGLSAQETGDLSSRLGFGAEAQRAINLIIGQTETLTDRIEGLRDANGATADAASRQLTPYALAIDMLTDAWERVAISGTGFINNVVVPLTTELVKAVEGIELFSMALGATSTAAENIQELDLATTVEGWANSFGFIGDAVGFVTGVFDLFLGTLSAVAGGFGAITFAGLSFLDFITGGLIEGLDVGLAATRAFTDELVSQADEQFARGTDRIGAAANGEFANRIQEGIDSLNADRAADEFERAAAQSAREIAAITAEIYGEGRDTGIGCCRCSGVSSRGLARANVHSDSSPRLDRGPWGS